MYLLFLHSTDDGDQEILAFVEAALDLLSKVTLGHLDIIFSYTVLRHEVEETIVNVDLSGCYHVFNLSQYVMRAHELVFVTTDVGNVHVVGRRTDIFLLGG